MLGFVVGFLIFQVLYHVLVTVLGYGVGLIDPLLFSLIRDGVWFGFCAVLFLRYWKVFWGFVKQWKRELLFFLVLLLFSLFSSYFFFEKGLRDILIGVKYGFWYLMIFFSAMGVGYVCYEEKKKFSWEWLKWLLLGVLVFWWIWQLGKVFFPEFFYSLGYDVLRDFVGGAKPPIYYLTGYEGTLRWQGLFAGPNNYGYFLVLFYPLLFFLFQLKGIKKLNFASLFPWLVQGLWITTLLATLSRSALLGLLVVLALLFGKMLFDKSKKWFFISIFLLFAGILGLSVLKWESTLVHFNLKITGFLAVFERPWGYGLGSSGPAIHHNGLLLPENYYVQLLLDLGVFGFVLWGCLIALLGKKQYCLATQLRNDDGEGGRLTKLANAFQLGMLAFFVMGLFLHVFEDSMVNYLFFVLYGLVVGAMSYLSFKR